MKRFISIALIFTTSMLFISCGGKQNKISDDMSSIENKEELTIGDSSKSKDGLVLNIEPRAYKTIPEVLAMTITNHTDSLVQFGADYTIEKLENDKWVKIQFPDDIAFIAIMYGLESGDTRKYDIYTYSDRLNYTSGRYRIVKSIMLGEERADYFGEFTIE